MIYISSPLSGFVDQILFSNGAPVRRGDIIAIYDAHDIDLSIGELRLLDFILKKIEARLGESHIQDRYNLFSARLDLGEKSYAFRDELVRGAKAQSEVGEASKLDVEFSEVERDLALMHLKETNLEKLGFEAGLVSSRIYIENQRQAIRVRIANLESDRNKTKLISPADGIIYYYVLEGGYADIGNEIAVLKDA